MTVPSHILGVILAGGSSRRMGGGDKGLADLGGRTMLAHVIDRFRPQVGVLVLNANGDPERFSAFGLPVVPDLDANGKGPMGGLVAAMHWAERTSPEVTLLATVTTDVPFLPLDLVARLAAESRIDCPALAVSAGLTHPAVGLWPLALKPHLQAALDRDALSLGAFARDHDAIAVSFPFSKSASSESGGVLVDPFFNANTPDDLKQARALITRNA
jgi:molybdopterin-guanine dinucleotide biosynthesis protein A